TRAAIAKAGVVATPSFALGNIHMLFIGSLLGLYQFTLNTRITVFANQNGDSAKGEFRSWGTNNFGQVINSLSNNNAVYPLTLDTKNVPATIVVLAGAGLPIPVASFFPEVATHYTPTKGTTARVNGWFLDVKWKYLGFKIPRAAK